MSEELKFQKLAEVELLEKAPEGSHPIVEHEGKIKRVTGGLDGGGIPVFDLTPYITEEAMNDADSGLILVTPSFTNKEIEDFIKLASAGVIAVHLDLGSAIGSDSAYVINQVFSTQYFRSGDAIRGVSLYGGIMELFLAMEGSPEFMSAVGFIGDEPQARFVFPAMIAAFFQGADT